MEEIAKLAGAPSVEDFKVHLNESPTYAKRALIIIESSHRRIELSLRRLDRIIASACQGLYVLADQMPDKKASEEMREIAAAMEKGRAAELNPATVASSSKNEKKVDAMDVDEKQKQPAAAKNSVQPKTDTAARKSKSSQAMEVDEEKTIKSNNTENKTKAKTSTPTPTSFLPTSNASSSRIPIPSGPSLPSSTYPPRATDPAISNIRQVNHSFTLPPYLGSSSNASFYGSSGPARRQTYDFTPTGSPPRPLVPPHLPPPLRPSTFATPPLSLPFPLSSSTQLGKAVGGPFAPADQSTKAGVDDKSVDVDGQDDETAVQNHDPFNRAQTPTQQVINITSSSPSPRSPPKKRKRMTKPDIAQSSTSKGRSKGAGNLLAFIGRSADDTSTSVLRSTPDGSTTAKQYYYHTMRGQGMDREAADKYWKANSPAIMKTIWENQFYRDSTLATV